MDKHLTQLRKIAEVILADELDYQLLLNTMEEYKTLLLELSTIELEDIANRKNIQFENGVAIGTTWAARCVDDIIRTRQFIRGAFKAVDDKLDEKEAPVHILYAGSGPFATLILPLLATYSDSQIQITVLEINPGSVAFLKRVISKLGFEKYFVKIENEDATRYKIDADIDILISETMQHALVKEQQVPIMLNLVNQLPSSAIIIPECIKLELAYMNINQVATGTGDRYKTISTLLHFNQSFINHHNPSKNIFDKSVELSMSDSKDFNKIVVLTSIQVYQNEWIKYDESGLTIPKILRPIPAADQTLGIKYVLGEIPGYEVVK